MIILVNKRDYNKFFLKLLIFIFIFSLVSGPFLPDLIVSISSIFFIYFMFKKKLFLNILENRLIFFLALFYIYIVFNSFFSDNIFISLKSSIPFFRLIFFALLLSYIFQNKEYKFFTLYIFIILYSLLFADVIFQVLYGFNILGYQLNINRVSGIFGDELILGSFVSRTYGIFIFLLFNVSPKNKIFLFLYTSTICLIMIVLSSERTALAIYLIIVFFALFYLSNKIRLLFILVIILSLIVGFVTNKNSYSRIIDHTYKQITENDSLNLFSFRHQLHFVTAYEIFKDQIFLGAGIKSFRNLCSKDKYEKKIHEVIEAQDYLYFVAEADGYYYEAADVIKIKYVNLTQLTSRDSVKKTLHIPINVDRNYILTFKNNGEKFSKGDRLFLKYEYQNGCNTHPHNFFIQFLSELGIIGALFFLIIYLKITIYLIKKIFLQPIKDTNYLLIAIFFATLFPLLPSGNFFNNYLSILTFLPLGFMNLWKSKN